MTSSEPVHTESETHTWTIDVGDHPTRTDSPEYVAAKKQMNEIAAGATGLIYGQPPYQDHHGSALWLQDAQGWFLVRNLAGIARIPKMFEDPFTEHKSRGPLMRAASGNTQFGAATHRFAKSPTATFHNGTSTSLFVTEVCNCTSSRQIAKALYAAVLGRTTGC